MTLEELKKQEEEDRLSAEAKAKESTPAPKPETATEPYAADPKNVEPSYVTESAKRAQDYINAEFEGVPIDIQTVFDVITPDQSNWAYMDGKMLLLDNKNGAIYDANEISKAVKDHGEAIRSQAGDAVADRFLKKATDGLQPKKGIRFTAESMLVPAIMQMQKDGLIPEDYDPDTVEVIKLPANESVSFAGVEKATAIAGQMLLQSKPITEATSVAVAGLAQSDDFQEASPTVRIYMTTELIKEIGKKDKELDTQLTSTVSQIYDGFKQKARQSASQSIEGKNVEYFLPVSAEDAELARSTAATETRNITIAEGKIKVGKIILKELEAQLTNMIQDPRRHIPVEEKLAEIQQQRSAFEQMVSEGKLSRAELAIEERKVVAAETEFEKTKHLYGYNNTERDTKAADLKAKIEAQKAEIESETFGISESKRKADRFHTIAERGMPLNIREAMAGTVSGIATRTAMSPDIASDIKKFEDDSGINLSGLKEDELYRHVAGIALAGWLSEQNKVDSKLKPINAAVYNEWMQMVNDGEKLPDSVDQAIRKQMRMVKDRQDQLNNKEIFEARTEKYEKFHTMFQTDFYKKMLEGDNPQAFLDENKAFLDPKDVSDYEAFLKDPPATVDAVLSDPKASRSLRKAALGELEKESATVAATVAESLKFVRGGSRNTKAGLLTSADDAITAVVKSGLKNEHKAALIGLIARNNEISGIARGEFVDGYGFDRLYEMHTALTKATGVYGGWADFMDMYAALDRKLGGVAKDVTNTQKKEIVNNFINEATAPLVNQMRAAAVSKLATGR